MHTMENIRHTSEPDDSVIIEKVIQGDANAFEILVRKYEFPVLRIVKRHIPFASVEETAQDVFIRSYQALPGLKKRSDFRNWISAIAVRTCYDFWRKKYRDREVPMSTLSEAQQERIEILLSVQAAESYEEMGRKEEAGELLDWALAQLSPEDRMVTELVYLEGLSGQEAAQMLGWTVANVKIRSFRARKKLRTLLSRKFGKKETQS
ncbi:MAG: RNA polymerase sigma factor [Desulfococcaceae bacterium]